MSFLKDVCEVFPLFRQSRPVLLCTVHRLSFDLAVLFLFTISSLMTLIHENDHIASGKPFVSVLFQQMFFLSGLAFHFFSSFPLHFMNVPLPFCNSMYFNKVSVDIYFMLMLFSLSLPPLCITHFSLGWRTGWTGWTMQFTSCGITPWAPLPPCPATSTAC